MHMNLLKHVKNSIELACAIICYPFVRLVKKTPLRIAICYHEITDIDKSNFSRQMAYLAKKNYEVVKLSDILTANVNTKKTIVAISFDDAFVSVLENALPSLKEFGLTASIAVPTDNLSQPPKWEIAEDSSQSKEFVMSTEQLKQIDKDGFELLSHTASHPFLTRISASQLKHELEDSKRTLEKIINHGVASICYPHGDYNANVCDVARIAGYKFGFTIEPSLADEALDNFMIGRFLVSPKDSLMKFHLKINGAYQVLKYLRTFKRKFTKTN